MRSKALSIAGAALALAIAIAGPARAFDPLVEAQNYNKGQERQTIYDTPQYQQELLAVSQQNDQQALTASATDPERQFQTDLCARGDNGCAGDARLYDWSPKGYGIVTPVLFTARDGATISGHIWATRAGPLQRNPNQSTGASGGGPAEQGCVDPKNRTVPPITKPALGMSADYFIPPVPLSDRWRHDGEEAAIDQPNHDGNNFSFYYRSRLDIHLGNGQRYDNEDLRDKPTGLLANDGYPGTYSYVSIARSPDTATTNWGSCSPAGK